MRVSYYVTSLLHLAIEFIHAEKRSLGTGKRCLCRTVFAIAIARPIFVTAMAKDYEFDSPSSHEGYGSSYTSTNDIQFFESSPLMSNNVTVEE